MKNNKMKNKSINYDINYYKDINSQDHNGWTLLMYGSEWGSIEDVKDYLQAGANPNIQDNDGSTALIEASDNGYKECVRLLLQAGANPYIKDIFGRTALTEASYRGYNNIIQILKRMPILHILNDY